MSGRNATFSMIVLFKFGTCTIGQVTGLTMLGYHWTYLDGRYFLLAYMILQLCLVNVAIGFMVACRQFAFIFI
jgi:hypothetical protein